MNLENRKLYRSRRNRMIGGVCGGLGDFFGIDPTLVRLLFVLGAIFGVGSFLLVYIAMLFIVPEEPFGAPVPPPATPAPPAPPANPPDTM